MPHLTNQIVVGGPLIDLVVGVSSPRRDALSKAKITVPSALPIRGLIDTGASCSCLDPTIIKQLGISPTGAVPIHTPSTDGTASQRFQYDVQIVLVHPNLLRTFHTLPVIESNLSAQGFHALIGRDILSDCLLIYDGVNRTYTLSF